MKLTEEQIDFIKENFFKNEDLVGWKTISDKLLRDGNCIVAGTGKLWYGGIGNFIQCRPAENAIGCSLLTFQQEEFLASEYFKTRINQFVKNTLDQIAKLQDQHRELHRLRDKTTPTNIKFN